MFKTNVKCGDIGVGDVLGPEDLSTEYKEFSLKPNKDTLENNERIIKELIRGKFPNRVNRRSIDSIYHYLDKYFLKYFVSLSNLGKNEKGRGNFSKFFIGVDDHPSVITGIPINRSYLPSLIEGINRKIIEYMFKIRAFHRANRSENYEEIGGERVYYFDRLLAIVFRLFKVNIYILKKNAIDRCAKAEVNDIYQKKREYEASIKRFRRHKTIITNLNNRYSQSLTLLLFDYEVVNRIGKYILADYPSFPFKDTHNLLKRHIVDKSTISRFVDNGHYVHNSIRSSQFTEEELRFNINLFLGKFREFRNIQIAKINRDRVLNPYTKKFHPMDRINTTLLQINTFNNIINQNSDVVQILIEIKIPIIKDRDAFLGYKTDDDKWHFPFRKVVNIKGVMSPITVR